jgi:hypothetical protein
MKLFWKQDKNSNKKTPETEQMSVDNIAKEKYEEKTGTELSPEMEGLFRKLAKAEFALQRTKQEVLTDASMKHILEMQQLLRTKLDSVERDIENTHHRLQWFDRYDQLIALVEAATAEKCKVLQEYTKQETERQAVDRFDRFEKVHGLFQKILIMTDLLAQVQQEQGSKHKLAQELQGTVSQLRNEYLDKERMENTTDLEIRAVQQRMNAGLELLGEINTCELSIEAITENLSKLDGDRLTALKEQEEVEKRRQETMRKREQATQDQQVLVPHRYVLENISMLQVKLNRLEVLRRNTEAAQNEFDRKQREYEVNNVALNNLFRKDQDMKSELSNLTQKLFIHKEAIHGQDLNSIQKRAFDLALQQNMLRRASFVWARICRCYDFLEEKTQEMNRTRLHYQTEEQNIEQMRRIIGPLRENCEQQKYAYTLSKSQDVSLLRQDLREGCSCSVCGATHHPYHSETEQALGVLQKALGRDFEEGQALLKQKEKMLYESEVEHAHERGVMEQLEMAIQTARLQLNEDKEQWKDFDFLGEAFADCSESVNRDARSIMLHQLQDNTIRQAEEAHKNMENFTNHQDNINQLNEQISELERRRDENRVGLNELNTACQVFSGLVEEEKLRLKKMSDEYSKLYSDLEHDMTLANWHAEWLENSESFRMNMQEKSSQWYKLLEQIQKLDVELAGLDAQLKGIASQLEMIEQNIAAQDDAKSKLIFLLNNKKETYSEIMGEKDPKEHLKELTEQKDKLSRERVKCRSAYDSANEYLLQTLGQSTTLLQQQQWQEQETMTLRSKLDMWMNRFNANHPPVQFAELERTYRSDTDWYTMRKETMKTTVQMQKVEEIEKSARNALVEWKNNIYAPQTRGTETEDSTRESLKTTLQELQKNGEEIRKQLAQIEARLERHEEAKQRTGIIEEQIQDIAKE